MGRSEPFRATVAPAGVDSQASYRVSATRRHAAPVMSACLAVGAALLLGLTARTARAGVCIDGNVGASCNTCFDCNEVECCVSPPSCPGWIPYTTCDLCKTICRCVNPDACAPDCNNNGVGDPLDISGGTSADCNLNGVPDDCEPDCNSNGLADECDIPGPTELYLPAVTYDVGADPVGLAFGDLDNDGDLDMVAGNQSGATISVRLNNGSGSFGSAVTYAAGGQPRSVAIGDLDRDGDQDVAVINITSHNVGVFLNNGNGTLAA